MSDPAHDADAIALEAEVARRALDRGLLVPGQHVVVAASAGADSTALAALLARSAGHGLPLDVVLAHVDHGWRGPEEAKADADVVRSLARRLGAAFALHPPPDVVRRTEDEARRHRYSSLARIARRADARTIATGHHLRDQAETFLLRLHRGAGPVGLAGIPERRLLHDGTLPAVEVVRPLLDVHPERLHAYLRARGLRWRDDPTNAGLERDRAVVRARLVAAQERGAALDRHLAEAAARFRRAVERREHEVEATLATSLHAHATAGAVEVSLDDARRVRPEEWPTSLRVLGRPLAADADGPWFERTHARLVAALVAAGGDGAAVDLPHGRRVLRSGGRVILASPAPPPPSLGLGDDGSCRIAVGASTLSFDRHTVPSAGFDVAAWTAARRDARPAGRSEAALDADRLGARVVLRGTRPSDAFEPLGRLSGSVLVDEFLAKQGLPGVLRRGALAVEASDGAVAWVVGHRVDRRYAVSPSTTRVSLLTVETA